MTATEEMIAQVSPYTVGSTGTAFTPALFTYLSGIALAELNQDGGASLPSAVFDHCHALLIAHHYAVKKGETGYESQSAQGYSVQRKIGETAFYVEYKKQLAKYQGGNIPSGSGTSGTGTGTGASVLRSDSTMNGLSLDEAVVPSFFTEG
jgi:hypothetical protein